jgi:hypothetical protein
MYQHVNEPTWARGGDNPSKLDLVISADEQDINDLEINSPLGASDHAMMTWDYVLGIEHKEDRSNKRNYNRMDVPKLQELHGEIDWKELLSQEEDNDEMYETFLSTLDNCVSMHSQLCVRQYKEKEDTMEKPGSGQVTKE